MLIFSKRLTLRLCGSFKTWLCLWKQSDMSTSSSVVWIWDCATFFPQTKADGESVWGNLFWKLYLEVFFFFFFSCLVLCPGDCLCPQATCFLCYIHIIHSHCLLLCSQLLEGSFTSQVSHEVDGLIFQPIGVSLTQIQTGRRKMQCDCKFRLWGKWRLDVTLPHNNYLQLAEESIRGFVLCSFRLPHKHFSLYK